MPEYDNNMSGSLFKNEKKEQPNHADYNGSAEIDGVQYYVNAWIKEIKSGDNKGKKRLSLSFKPKDNGGYGDRRRQPQRQEPEDDGIGF